MSNLELGAADIVDLRNWVGGGEEIFLKTPTDDNDARLKLALVHIEIPPNLSCTWLKACSKTIQHMFPLYMFKLIG